MNEVYSLTDLRDWRTTTGAEQPPLNLAVFGDPVAHSASPPMHNAALAALGIDARYCRLHIRPEELATALRMLPEQGFIGPIARSRTRRRRCRSWIGWTSMRCESAW